MTATDLAQQALATDRPIAMPRSPYLAKPNNPEEFFQYTQAVLAGLAQDMAMNPEYLSADKASTIMGRVARSYLAVYKPFIAPPPPQPARGARAPLTYPTAQAPTPSSTEGPASNGAGPQASASDNSTPPTTPPGQFKYRLVETPEEWEARHKHLLSQRQNEAPPTT